MSDYDLNSKKIAKLIKEAIVPFNFMNFFPSADYMWEQAQPKTEAEKTEPKSNKLMKMWAQMVHRPGVFIKETNKILIKPDLPKSILVATIAHESIHFLKANGILVRDVPLAAAWGYFKRWIFETKNPEAATEVENSTYSKQDDWTLVLTTIEEGRSLAITETVQRKVDDILEVYDEIQEEDELSYRWGALLAGIAIELPYGLRYLSRLAKGDSHSQGVIAAKE